MKSMMARTTLREIKQSLGRFLAIFAIVCLGVGLLPDLKLPDRLWYGRRTII